jgi:putative aminopeptidase FrvX
MDLSPQQFLARLVETPGPVGSEAPVVAAWLEYVKPFADETYTDAYGNGYAVLNPAGDPEVVVTGHADELGLMVSYIDDEGFIWVSALGGYDPKILPTMHVRIFASGPDAKGPLPGVIGALPPHMQLPDSGGAELKRYKFGENVYVDIGARDRAQAERFVRVGDSMVLDYGFFELRRDLVVGRALDNKIGIWSAAECLRRCSVKRGELQASVIALATVQEEIGGFGATMAAFRLNPDAAIAIDVTQALDHPGTDRKRFGDAKLGRGPVIPHGSVCHPELVARLERVAKRQRIELQHEAAARFTGTDGDNFFHSREGIPTAVVSLPQRYMHSPAEMVNTRDLEDVAELLAGFCLDLKSGERFAVKV